MNKLLLNNKIKIIIFCFSWLLFFCTFRQCLSFILSALLNISKMNFIGNNNILEIYKIGFLCSKQVPSHIIPKAFEWAIKQREEGLCIITGAHSRIEQEVFQILLKGNQP